MKMEVHSQARYFLGLVLMILFTLESLNLVDAANGTITTTNSSSNVNIGPDYEIKSLNRSSFPQGFLFGTASSAYQYEGAAREDGRGPSMWDTFTHKFPEKIADRSNGDIADDSYHRYKEDVKIMKEMGVDAYRISISWPRLLPYGKVSKGVNKRGITYYHNLIDELLANGIQPFVTLFHWDIPQSLQDEYGGFLNPLIVADFRDYTELCFKEFGSKVKNWITLNEPFTYSVTFGTVGTYSSKQCSKSNPKACDFDSATQPYLLGHYQLLAHAAAVQLYRLKFQATQKGAIGISLNSNWYIPISQARHNQNAALRALDFTFGWFMDPITYGDYPHTMRSLVGERLPKFTKAESIMLKGSYDFLGLNYYTSNYASYAPSLKNAKPSYITDSIANLTTARNGVPIGPQAASSWLYSYPRGIYDLLLYISKKYKNPVIYITENGWSEANNAKLSLEEALADGMRIQYFHDHLAFAHAAIRDGARLRGYFAWSLLDNFEWTDGYTVRFGINFVDYKDRLKRYSKHSAIWFKNFLGK